MVPTLPRPLRVLLLAAGLGLAAGASAARAGGGPENLLLVVNPRSADSLTVANAYAARRGIAPINVLMLPWSGEPDATTIARFRGELLEPILRAIEARRLTGQIDQVVYSCGFPTRIDYGAELPDTLRERDRYPAASLTGLTMLHAAVQSGRPGWLDAESNDYYRRIGPDGLPAATCGFRGWYGWGQRGELLEAGGSRYLLSVMLGVTAAGGSTVAEVVHSLETAAAADGTRPAGTIYFMSSGDVRSTTRSGGFAPIVRALAAAGVKAEIVPGTLPSRKRDVAGLVAGAASFDWAASGSTILPGAICENLTSFGGVFGQPSGQTPLTEFLRGGAAGSSGTITEPFSIQAKFPHPSIQLHYARGASLAEAFYQSVQAPYQLLVVGDPLCQPWARIPAVEITTADDGQPLSPGRRLSGAVRLMARATVPAGGAADRLELYVDGIRTAQAAAGDALTLDTTALADGHHEIRVVAIDASPVETQGRRIVPIEVDNRGLALELGVEPKRVRPDGSLRVTVTGRGAPAAAAIEEIVVFAAGRVLGRIDGAEGTIDVPANLLGRGPVAIRALGHAGATASDGVAAAPVTIEVTARP